MIDMKEMAALLRLPTGENANHVTEFMSKANKSIYQLTYDTLDLDQKSELNILEIGPANGYFVKDLFERNNKIKYTGVDLSEDMIEAAKKLNENLVETGTANFMFGNVSSLSFSDQTFDVIFSVNTIYFWKEPKLTVQELKRVLKPNGIIAISIRSKESMIKMPFTEFGFELYTKEMLQGLFSLDLFKLVSINEIIEKIVLPKGKVETLESYCLLAQSH